MGVEGWKGDPLGEERPVESEWTLVTEVQWMGRETGVETKTRDPEGWVYVTTWTDQSFLVCPSDP